MQNPHMKQVKKKDKEKLTLNIILEFKL